MALFNLVEQNITDAITSFTQDSYVLAGQVIKREKEVNRLEEHIRKKYIQRLNSGAGLPSDGILFVDIVFSTWKECLTTQPKLLNTHWV